MSCLVPHGDHRVHGMGAALEAPTWPPITDDEAAEALAHFPAAGRPETLCWHSPRPFSAATLAQTEQGAFLLKRHHARVRSSVALEEEHRFIVHLRAAGLSTPEVMRATDGSGAIALGEWRYELHRKAEGLDLYRERLSWTPFLSHDHAQEAGRALARLHLAARGFEGAARGPHPLVASLTILPARDPIEAAADYIAARPSLGRYLAGKPWREELTRLFATWGEGLSERLHGQARLWTHNDWHPSNLLWSSDGAVSSVFDFGLATRTCALHDIATAIERTAIRWLELGEGEGLGDVAAACALLSGYEAVIPLGAADVETIVRLMPLVHVEFALSEADYFAGLPGGAAQADMAWQGYLIDHADWFLSPEGDCFLRDLRGGAAG